MKRLIAFVSLSLALSACGGGHPGNVPAVNPETPNFAPSQPSALRKAPESRDFARPALPNELQKLAIGGLTTANRAAALARRDAASATRSTSARSSGFFANETYVGKDANGFAAYWMPYFGFYTYGSAVQGAVPFPGFLYKYSFAWLYDLGGTNASASDAYFFDFGTPDGYIGVFYTAPTYGSDANSLYVYSFLLNHFLSYQQSSYAPRWFYDYNAAAWLTGNAALSETAGGAAAWVRPDTHRTLYYLDVDTASAQMCTGGCLSAWPAFGPIPNSKTTADMAIITRSDGGEQWTYQGHPLYSFAGDSGPDQVNGDGVPDFAGHWHVARPAGSVAPPTDPPGPGCHGYGCT